MIDIIVPIYNAYEDLVKCVASVWKHTDLNKNRLILINDKSTDDRISPYLESISGENMIVHNSDRNEGFSSSVNTGMNYSKENDVLLLNSDTIVTAGWLGKIRRCAYSENNIATVTPLSNSATIASIPVIGQDNAVPANVTIDQYADIIEKCSFRDYPQITVAVGFCMYIKRKVLNEIGFFDKKTFKRGYGEENDFCCRAEMMGYKHVLCDDTFIYHKGTASFAGEQKKALMEEHVRVLESRYPVSMRNNHIFCMSKPFQYIRDNIEMFVQLFNGKKNILYVLHSDFREDASDSVGGTQLHVRDLTECLSRQYNIYIFARHFNNYRLSCYVDSKRYTFEFENSNISSYPVFSDAALEKTLDNMIAAFRIDLVHVHHLHGMTLEIYYSAERMGIPIITTVHDFYMACPTHFLYSSYDKNCTGPSTSLCRECLKIKAQIWDGCGDYITKWRDEMLKALIRNKMMIFPSKSARDIFNGIYGDIVEEKVVRHGVNQDSRDVCVIEKYEDNEEKTECNIEYMNLAEENAVKGWAYIKGVNNRRVKVIVQVLQNDMVIYQTVARKSERQDVDVFFGKTGEYLYSGFEARIIKNLVQDENVNIRILLSNGDESIFLAKKIEHVTVKQEVIGNGVRAAFIGGLSDIKGSRIACDMIKNGPDIEWFIFGNIDPKEELYGLELSNLHKFGFYRREDIHRLLVMNKIDVVCIMSVCAETFCYTLSEAMQAKIPILAYDVGAVGERIKETGTGILVPLDAVIETILDKVRDISDGKDWIDVRKKLEDYTHKTVKEMADEYDTIYNNLIKTVHKQDSKPFHMDVRMISAAYQGRGKNIE